MMPRWLAVLLLSCSPCFAMAHTLSIAYVDVFVADDSNDIRLELDLAVRDIALTLPLDSDGDHVATWGELVAAKEPLQTLVAAGLSIESASGACTLQPGALGIRRYEDSVYAVIEMRGRCPSKQGLHLDYRLLSDIDPQHRALVTLRRGSVTTTAIATATHPRVSISSAQPPFVTFFREGVHHILIGYDHLAFLLSLLLPAVLVRKNRRWDPAPNLRDSFIQVAATVTAFTLAHSVTLALAALGMVVPASRWVEALIAVSVMLAAMNNVYPVVTRRLWLVGFGFGLVHGFGFAGALGELGLPKDARLWALLGFNLGVEAGQLLAIAILLPVLHVLSRRRWYSERLVPIGSVGIAVLAGWWLIERLR